MTLRPCPRCRRHVRERERCPFCGAVGVLALPRPVLAGRLSRAAVFASATLAGCSSASPHSTPPGEPAVRDAAVIADATPLARDASHIDAPGDAGALPADAALVQAPAPLLPDAGVVERVGTAIIRGTVRNRDGTIYVGAQVSLRGAGQIRNTTTDAKGRYVLTALPAGDYAISIEEVEDGPRGDQLLGTRGVTLRKGASVTIDLSVPPPTRPIDHGPCCKPYGAPPARRRVV